MESLKYRNHAGEEVIFDGRFFFIDFCELKDYAWNFDTDFDKIRNFSRDGVTTKQLKIAIFGKNKSHVQELCNQIFKTFEIDVLAGVPGRFYFGDYYFECFVTSSKKDISDGISRLVRLEFAATSDKNVWMKDSAFTFVKNQPISGHGYPYKYPYGYSCGVFRTILNESLTESNFLLRLFGPVQNPSVFIGSHVYNVNIFLESGEFLEISSSRKSVEKVLANGSRVSVFAFRNRESYIFQKIPAGTVAVSWNNEFSFDLVVFDERGEPSWT